MEEQQRGFNERRTVGPSGLSDPFETAAEEFGGMANINGEDVPVSGMSLGEIRHRLADRFGIDPASTMHINGEQVTDVNRIICAGERVEFLRQAGEKGATGQMIRFEDS